MNIGLVGSTNVGKSTLFNRLIGQFRAIVTDIPGTTRDIIEHETLIDDIGKVTFLDSPGLLDFKEEEVLIKQIINYSDLILFVIDDSVGITAKEQHIYSYIIEKNKKKNTILIVNKIDIKHKEKEYDLAVNEYYKLGFENVIGISAKKQKNVSEVKDIITKTINSKKLKENVAETEALTTSETNIQDNRIHMAIIGKPNAGKSTLTNAFMKKVISKVENIPGTTRDYVVGEFKVEKKKYVVYDTAGIRKKGDIHGIEKIAFEKTVEMLKYKRPIILFLVDATEGISHRDMTLIQEINNLALPMVMCLNKIDLLSPKEKKLLMAKSKAMLDFAKYIPLFSISAKTKRGIGEVFEVLSNTKKAAEKRVDTSELNDIIGKEFISRPPRFPKNKICKILYITQVDINAPTFLVFVNHKNRANFAFKRRLENTIRIHFGFMGTPLVIRFKERKDSRLEKKDEEEETTSEE
ncbi:MAG: ribosome biogenesis GTPase Der [candidate division SR1 bacterium]|nr:ribosome biogenesis GTPase Der [candidate division SR1 bacterium]